MCFWPSKADFFFWQKVTLEFIYEDSSNVSTPLVNTDRKKSKLLQHFKLVVAKKVFIPDWWIFTCDNVQSLIIHRKRLASSSGSVWLKV